MTPAYIHGTHPDEQARLSRLNAMTNGPFLDFVCIPPGSRVLDVGSGLGILASDVAHADPTTTVVGVEQAWLQLANGVRHPRTRLLQGDAHQLAFKDGAFDVVYARYVLEHVGDPAHVLSEMHRVLRPGGIVAVLENDISLVRFDPPCPTFEGAWAAFAAFQSSLGGDALIGRRLFRLLRQAGFVGIELSFQPELHWHGSPGLRAWIENIIGNLESARLGLTRSGFLTSELLESAAAELRSLATSPDASAGFCWNRARAVKA